MTNETTNNEFYNIELVNGTILQGILKPTHPEEIPADTLALDQSGNYLQTSPQALTDEAIKAQMREEERNVFLPNAFFLLQHADRILSDSRMFLAPIPVQSGIAYTGTSGFRNPTLGIYIEWWQNCPESHWNDKDGNPTLVYHLAGSPLSGCNQCAMTDAQGTFMSVKLPRFLPLWQSFMHINTRYTEAKALCECYTLQQVIDILKSENL